MRGLAWAAGVMIAVAVLIMAAVSAAGPSIAVVYLPRPASGPPWWIPVRLGSTVVSVLLWIAAVLGAAGVIAGLVAVTRGARPSVRGLLAFAFLAISVLTVLPAAGSTDVLDYAADGRMVVVGRSPYVMTPLQLKAYHHDPIGRYIPSTWDKNLSVYGPLATAEEWVSAELGGASVARVTFWLKLWNALGFAAVVLALDRMLRSDPAMRLRAHLLWSANPLLLWEIVASGHIDGIGAAFGLLGVVAVRLRRPGEQLSPWLAAAAGVLIGLAAAVKAPFAIFGVGAAWALRKSPVALAGAGAGFLAVFAPMYLVAGRPAIKALVARGPAVTWDNLYQLFYRPFGYRQFGVSHSPPHIAIVAAFAFLAVAALVFVRLPDRMRALRALPALPAVRPALALTLAWLFVWPFQRPWYDVMAICLLVLYPASRLDWVVLIRLLAGATVYMPGIPGVYEAPWVKRLVLDNGLWVTSSIRLLAVLALVWLCVTGAWGWRTRPCPGDPVPLPLLSTRN